MVQGSEYIGFFAINGSNCVIECYRQLFIQYSPFIKGLHSPFLGFKYPELPEPWLIDELY